MTIKCFSDKDSFVQDILSCPTGGRPGTNRWERGRKKERERVRKRGRLGELEREKETKRNRMRERKKERESGEDGKRNRVRERE